MICHQVLKSKVDALPDIASLEALAERSEAEVSDLQHAINKAPTHLNRLVRVLQARIQIYLDIVRPAGYGRSNVVLELALERVLNPKDLGPFDLNPDQVLRLACKWIERFDFQISTDLCRRLVSFVGARPLVIFLARHL